MAKSYKITVVEKFDDSKFGDRPLTFGRQLQIEGTRPGPETRIHKSQQKLSFADFQPFDIEHEYDVYMYGRLYDDERSFNKFIARSEIRSYYSGSKKLMLLCGKKADILDFCRKTEELPLIKLKTLQIDMKALQERLPEVRGVWFRFRTGLIRAKGFMGQQIQDTREYQDANTDGDISTLSFYFSDERNAIIHPIQITEDGAVVLQKNYQSIEEELDFILQVRTALLDGIFSLVDPGRQRRSAAELPER